MRKTAAHRFVLGLFLWRLTLVASPIVVPPVLGFPSSTGQYRLIFETSSTTAATSSDIAYYNQFVTNVANSVPELAALNTQWNVVGSTNAVQLSDNVGLSFVPIHRLDGQYVATAIVNLSIGPLSSLITVDEHGNPIAAGRIWTGLNGNTLGSATPTYGDPPSITFGLHDGTATNTDQYHLYAISGILQETPEPGSMGLLALGASALLAACRNRGSSTSKREQPNEARTA